MDLLISWIPGGFPTSCIFGCLSQDCLALCDRDSLIVGIGNVLTSIFAGFVIFPIIGYLAKELDMEVDKVVEQGGWKS